MFGYSVGFSGTVDLMALFSIRINSRWRRHVGKVRDLLSGVIQGSVLGPLMFLIYINDLAKLLAGFNIIIKLFADDVKLYVKVIGPVDESELKNALSALVSWDNSWQLSISTPCPRKNYNTVYVAITLAHNVGF